MPKGIRMKSAMRMPIAKPLASGERPGGTATNRVSQSSSFMVSCELRVQYIDIAAVTGHQNGRGLGRAVGVALPLIKVKVQTD